MPLQNRNEIQRKSKQEEPNDAACEATTDILTKPRLYLINPSNPQVSMINTGESRWNRYRVWKPLGLMIIAGLTPEDWDVTVIDENLSVPEYASMPRPNLVGITAFTSQAHRAYSLSSHFRSNGVPVVIGGIHASMCTTEALEYADSVVSGEAESVWSRVLADSLAGQLKPLYEGGFAELTEMVPARHDLLRNKYAFGAVQTTRGCPLQCSFCSVTAFNGARFRQHPIEHVVSELKNIPEDLVLIVDDNLIGTRIDHSERAKTLFRAMIVADLKKQWIAPVTINVANDDELPGLATAAGGRGVFIGFESPDPSTSKELARKNNLCRRKDLKEAVQTIQKHGILVVGSFIICLDGDTPGIGKRIADTAERYGVDFANVLFLTPLPETKLWEIMVAQYRVPLCNFPSDWRYFTLTFPVARFLGFSAKEAVNEMMVCSKRFYSIPRILRRLCRHLWRGQKVAFGFVGGMSFRKNIPIERRQLTAFLMQSDDNVSSVNPNTTEASGRRNSTSENRTQQQSAQHFASENVERTNM
ncbi:MAG: B12-binding domain-containing radical SAM protein [Deltaproteobacteria bacterium]|nr:B12-binding domain-containing radical SAM protein [Deltaproteobacteria bacterium]